MRISRKAPFYTLSFVIIVAISCFQCQMESQTTIPVKIENKDSMIPVPTILDTAAYDQKLIAMSNGDTTGKWPIKNIYPLPGALLPFNRIIAYYGNLYSKGMGILGELPEASSQERAI